MDVVDLQAKYQTLAAEYSKVTAKCTVLKKAVLDEQAKSAQLKDELTETDRQLRQQQQEVDSLTFRNSQLTRRVAVLQDELEPSPQHKHSKKRGLKSSGPEPVPASNLNVLEEELMSKINANVKLNEMLSESESRHQEEVGTLTSRLRQLEASLNASRTSSPQTPQTPPTPPQAAEPRPAVCTDCERRRTQLRAATSQLQQCETERGALTDRLAAAEAEAATLRRTLAQYAPLVDTGTASLDRLNVPTADRSEQTRAGRLSAELSGHLSELTAALANYHTYCEQRLHALSSHGLSAVRSKLSELLLAHRFSLSPVPAALRRLTEALSGRRLVSPHTLPELMPLAEAVRTYHVFLSKVVSYQQLSLQEETSLEASGQHYLSCMTRLTDVFGRLQSALTVLAKQTSDGEQPRLPTSVRLIALLGNILDALHAALRDLSKSYTLRMSEEHELPSTSAALRTTNECILSSLVAATTAADKLRSAWSSSQPWMSRLSTAIFRCLSPETGVSVAVNRRAARAAAYLAVLDAPVGGRGSYEHSLSGSLHEPDEAETAAQLDQCHKTIVKLEQSKERWRLEYQLIKAKYQRLQEETATPSALEPPAPSEESSGTVSTPDGEVRTSSHPWADMEAREARLKADLASQLDQMVERQQTAEGKCRHFQIECRHLVRTLTAVEQTCTETARQLCDAESARQALREELVTTAASYETQVAAMSDHLAGLNETLTAQRDQIDQLRYQLGQKKRANR